MDESIILNVRQMPIIGYLKTLGLKGTYKNGKWTCCSPLRDEKNPSFSVHVEKNVWYDYGLWEGGDLIKLVMRLNGFTFKKAIGHLVGFNIDENVNDEAPTQEALKEVKTEVPPDKGQSVRGRKTVERYFQALGLPYYPEMGAFPLSYRGKNFIGIPVSTPADRQGVECRGFTMTPQGIIPNRKSRFCLGNKTPWLLRRDPERYLVTESVNDSLAGEIILGDNERSLIGLTGAGLRKRLTEYIPQGSDVLLGMDNDGMENDRIGQLMEEDAAELLRRHNCYVSHVTHHIKAGVKDLYRLLQFETRNK